MGKQLSPLGCSCYQVILTPDGFCFAEICTRICTNSFHVSQVLPNGHRYSVAWLSMFVPCKFRLAKIIFGIKIWTFITDIATDIKPCHLLWKRIATQRIQSEKNSLSLGHAKLTMCIKWSIFGVNIPPPSPFHLPHDQQNITQNDPCQICRVCIWIRSAHPAYTHWGTAKVPSG